MLQTPSHSPQRPPQAPPAQILRILWTALAASQCFYLFILHSKNGVGPLVWISADPQFVAHYAVAAVIALLSYFLPRKIFQAATKSSQPAPDDKELIQLLMVPFILRLALGEAVCIFGFIIALHTKQTALIAPFMIVSLGILALNFPSDRKIKTWITDKTF